MVEFSSTIYTVVVVVVVGPHHLNVYCVNMIDGFYTNSEPNCGVFLIIISVEFP